MAPEYGATCGFFPVDAKTIDYMRFTGRSDDQIALVEAYCKAQGMWHDENAADPIFTDTLALHMTTVEAPLAGPKRPQDRLNVNDDDTVLHDVSDTGSYNKPPKHVPGARHTHAMGTREALTAKLRARRNNQNQSRGKQQ